MALNSNNYEGRLFSISLAIDFYMKSNVTEAIGVQYDLWYDNPIPAGVK